MSPTVAAPPLPAPAVAGEVAGGEPASALEGTVAASMGLLVAPTTGRFRALAHSGVLRAGQVLGVVTGGRGRADEVRVPVAAEVCGLLALEGQIVQVGQALAWVRRR
jgi:biotin carboxyl carrier protein